MNKFLINYVVEGRGPITKRVGIVESELPIEDFCKKFLHEKVEELKKEYEEDEDCDEEYWEDFLSCCKIVDMMMEEGCWQVNFNEEEGYDIIPL